MTAPAEEPDLEPRARRELTPRAGDLPYFYVLLALHLALLVALPVGAWVLAPVVRRLVALGRLPKAAPALGLALLLLAEFGFFHRARRVWRRLRSVASRR